MSKTSVPLCVNFYTLQYELVFKNKNVRLYVLAMTSSDHSILLLFSEGH